MRHFIVSIGIGAALAACGGSRSQPAVVESGGLEIRAAVEPAALRVGDNRLWLELRDAGGEPVTGAGPEVVVQMHAMGAMPAMGGPAAVHELGGGRYRADFSVLGALLDPHAAFLIQRGLKTYFVRYREQTRAAQAIAEHLLAHPAVSRVHYPGLPGHPQAALARGAVDVPLEEDEAARVEPGQVIEALLREEDDGIQILLGQAPARPCDALLELAPVEVQGHLGVPPPGSVSAIVARAGTFRHRLRGAAGRV